MSIFLLTEDQKMVQELARGTAVEKVKTYAAAVDQDVRCPVESIAALAEAGLIGLMAPEEFEGPGLDYFSHILAMEEVAKVCASTAGVILATMTGMECLLKFGTPEQKAGLLPQVIAGQLVSMAANENAAGLDPYKITTKAEQSGDEYIINGTKRFIANAGFSDYYIVVCSTDESADRNELTAFIVDKDNPGIKFGRLSPKMGLRACVAGDVVLENCTVKADSILGGLGKGAGIISTAQDSDRLGMAAKALGIAQGAMDEAIKYVNERVQFGKRIAQFQNTQFVMAELQAKINAARMLLWSAAAVKDQSQDYSVEAAMAKLVCTDVANEATRKCVQFMGGFGYSREYPVERMMRDAKMTEIYGGTSEEQKALIAGKIGVC